jgi:NAD(P)H-dependent flavin oxidoreductase YrpB (nitropropane dioxygenase family)
VTFRFRRRSILAHRAYPRILGILTALSQPSPDALRTAIRETRRLTNKPFGVNLTLLPTINPPDYQGFARAAVEEGVRIFETAGNNRERIRFLRGFARNAYILKRARSSSTSSQMVVL